MAKKRLNGVERKLCRDNDLRTMYCHKMLLILSQGYAKRAPEEELDA